MSTENDILEKTLSLAESNYAEAYDFLLGEYEKTPALYGPQTLYFLACLAGGAGMPDSALSYIRKAVSENGWWYRPEVLDDDDLECIKENAEFVALKAVSDSRYKEAVTGSKAVFSFGGKKAENLFLAVHGNTQNAQTARDDWKPFLACDDRWQAETIQSAEPDGYGTYRWSYDETSYLPVAEALETVRNAGFKKVVCGGFSAGCDMLLRSVLFTPARPDMLILQSPWIPLITEQEQKYAEVLAETLAEKKIALKIFCGADDADCLPLAERLFDAVREKCADAELFVTENCRHGFSALSQADEMRKLFCNM